MGYENCEGYCLADMGLKSATECAPPATSMGTESGGCRPGEPCSMPDMGKEGPMWGPDGMPPPMLGPDGMPPMEE